MSSKYRHAVVDRGSFARAWAILLLAVGLIVAGPAFAITRYVSTTGSDAANNCSNSGIPCRTIPHALDQVLAGDVIEVAGGVYDGPLDIDTPVTLRGMGTTVAAGPLPGYTSVRAPAAAPLSAIVVVSAPDVTITNINFQVDLALNDNGILTRDNGGLISADRLHVIGSRIESVAFGAPVGTRRRAINVNVPPSGGNADDIEIRDNFIVADTTVPTPTYFRAGVEASQAELTITGNDIRSNLHDVLSKFCTGNQLLDDNDFRGGGVELGEYNAPTTSIQVTNNRFTPPSPLTYYAGLRLQNNQPVVAGAYPTTLVQGNSFGTPAGGHAYGVFLQKYPAVAIRNNTFFPAAPSPYPFTGAIVVSNKVISSNSDTLGPQPLRDIEVSSNIFNGAPFCIGPMTCYGVMLLDHDNDDPPFPDPVTLGGAGPLSNTFDASLSAYVWLDDFAGPAALDPVFGPLYGGIGATTAIPFLPDVPAPDNVFAGIQSSGMTVEQLISVAAKIFDLRDAPTLGLVRLGTPNVGYSVTGPTSFLPRDAGGFDPCPGVDGTACFDVTLSNVGGTAVPEYSAIAFTVTRTGGINAGDAVMEIEQTPGGPSVPISLTPDSGNLIGTFQLPTVPPAELGANSAPTIRVLRVHFPRGGDYQIGSSFVGIATNRGYEVPDGKAFFVADVAESLTGPSTADFGTPVAFNHVMNNADGGTSEPLTLTIDIVGQDGVAPADIALTYDSSPVTFVPNGTGVRGTVAIAPLAANEVRNDAVSITFASGEFDSYQFSLSLDGTILPSRHYASAAKLVVVGTPLGGGRLYVVRSIGDSSSVASPADNDYTRIDNVVQLLQNNDTLRLQGTFDWAQLDANASWTLGSDHVPGNDDFSIDVPPGRTGLTFTALNANGGGAGGATILGGGDIASRAESFESFLHFFDDTDLTGATSWQGLTISNLHLGGFDFAILADADGLNSPGVDDFDNATYENLTIDVPVDVTDGDQAADFFQNVGLFVGWGSGQTVRNNVITLHGAASANGDSSALGMQIGDSTNTNAFDGLQVLDNDIVAADAGLSRLRGIYENVGDTGSAMTIARNTYTGVSSADNTVGLVMTSHSSAGKDVVVRDNNVSNAGVGVRVDSLFTLPSNTGILFDGNNLVDNGTGLRVVQFNAATTPPPVLRGNRIVGNIAGVEQTTAGTIDARDNWWGCNGGPAAQPAGCSAATNGTIGTVDASTWLVLSGNALPTPITAGSPSTFRSNFYRNNLGADTSGLSFPAGLDVSFSAAPDGAFAPPVVTTTTAPRGRAVSTYTSITQGVKVLSATADAQTVSDSILVLSAGAVVITPAPTPTATDNDYTRINNAIQLAANDVVYVLDGTFDWTEPFAAASWALGSDGIAATDDDYTILPPGGFTGVTITAANLGDGTIQGPGDLAGANLEGPFTLFAGGYRGWTFSNLELLDFDFGIGMFWDASINDFDNVTVTNNRIRLAADLNATVAPADVNQNIALHLSFGLNQTISNNQIEIDSTGLSDTGNNNLASSVALQSNTSGNNAYNGLAITGNTVTFTGTIAPDPARLIGIWENDNSFNGTNITISDNSVLNQTVGAVPVDRWIGFRMTSTSGAGGNVVYADNTVDGLSYGFVTYPGLTPSGGTIFLRGNTITNNNVGVQLLTSNAFGVIDAQFNRIVGNATGIDADDDTVIAPENWWGCNGGPGAQPAGCTNGANPTVGNVTSSPWLRLSVAASPSTIVNGDSTPVTASLDDDNLAGLPLDIGDFPSPSVAFATNLGSVTPPSNAIAGGTAGTTYQSVAPGAASVTATLDAQTAYTLVRIDPAAGGGGQTFTIVSCTSDPVPCTPDEFDNDYTRIDDLVQVLRNDDTVILQGFFDWSTGAAFDSWSRGSDHAANTPDDYSSLVPAGITGLTFTAANDQGSVAGGATIAGGGDTELRSQTFESFLRFEDFADAPTTWQGLTIENLELSGFDFALFLTASQSGNGNDDFDGATIQHNTIYVPADASGGVEEFVQNIGLYLGYGSGQLVDDNEFYLDSTGSLNSAVYGIQIGDSSNSTVFDGLTVTDNEVTVGNAGPARVRGIYENAGDTGSTILIAGNDYAGEGTNDVGLTVTSFGGPNQVQVLGNTITGAELGLRISALVPATGGQSGAFVEGNTLLDNATAVRVLVLYTAEPPPPVLRFNRIANNGTGLDNQITATVSAENNWWGCNDGPGATNGGCAYGPGHDGTSGAVDADPWLNYAIEAQSPIVPPGGFTDVQADVHTNSALQDVSAGAVAFPTVPVPFNGGSPGTFSPTSDDLAAGFAESRLSNITSTASFSSTLDGQSVFGTIQVEQLTLEVALPSAAARGVTTRPFTATITNTGAFLTESGSIVLTLARSGGPLVPSDVQLQFQLPIGPPIFITIPLSDSNGDGQLEGTIPALPLLPGTFTLNLRATFFVAGTYTLDSLVVGNTTGFFYSQDHDVIVVADDTQIRVTATGGTPQTAPVNALYTLPLRARVTDLAGRPLSGVTVGFAMPPLAGATAGFGPAGTVLTQTRVTDLAGDVVSSTLRANDTAGPFSGTASVAGPVCVGATCSASYSLVNTAGSPATVDLTILTNDTTQVATAFGTGADVDLSALVLDIDGNPVSGASVAFVSLGVDAGALFPSGTGGYTVLTNASGIATVAVDANTLAGSYDVRAVVATTSGQASDDVTLTNTPNTDPAQWIVSLASGSPQTASLNQLFAVPLAVLVTDQYGNPLDGISLGYVATPAGTGASAQLGGVTASTGPNGIASITVTANNIAGNYIVTASAAPPCTSGQCTVVFALINTLAIPEAVTASDGTPQSAIILTAFGERLVAKVSTVGGAGIEGISVTFVAPSSGPRATFNLPGNPSAAVVVSDSEGFATSPVLTAGGTAGNYSVLATASGPTGPLTANFALTNLVGAANSVTIVAGSPQTAAINTAYATPLRVRVADAGGNAVEDVDVAFAAGVNGTTGASASLTFATVATDANGEAQVSATANGFVGAFDVTATADGVATPVQFSLENVFDDDNVDLVVDSADATGVVVEAPLPTPVAQRSNYQLSLSGTSTENVFVRIAIGRVGGIATGDVTLEYRDPTTGGNFIPFSPQPTLDVPSGLLIARYGPAAGFPLFPAPGITAEIRATFARGGAYTAMNDVVGQVSAQVYDSEAIDTDVAELALTGTDPGVAVAGEYTGSSVNLSNLGTAGLSALLDPPNDENVVGRFVITRTGGLTSATQVDVQYFDQLSSTWTSIPLSLVGATLEGSFGGAGFPVPAGYDATTLFRTRFDPTGSYTVAFRIDGVDSGVTYASDSTAVQVDTGEAATITIVSGTPQSAVVAQAFGAPLIVEVRDAGGNVVPGAAISFAAPGAGASATFTSTNPTTTDANGLAQVTVTAGNIAGAYQVTATSTAGSVLFDLTNTSDTAPNQLVVTATAGTPQTAALNQAFAVPLTVNVADRFGNAVAGSSVTFTPPASGATAALVPAGAIVTNAQGIATTTATANGTPGSYSVAAAASPCSSPTCNTSFALSNTIATPATVTAFAGTPQSTVILTAFGAQLVAEVRDASSAPLQGISVTFVAPSTGASATFNVAGNPSAVVAITGANGRATSPALTANGTAGSYNVTATASGPSGPLSASFALTNTVGAPAQLQFVAGSPQQAAINTAFATQLRVRVVDAGGNGLSGVTVAYAATPNVTTGASAGLTAPPITTDATGFAQVAATANGFVGAYTVSATTAGVATPVVFQLTNVFDADSVDLQLTGGATTGVVVRAPLPTPVAQRTENVFNVSGTATENVTVQLAIARAGGAATGDVTLEYRDATTAGAFVAFATQPTLDVGSGNLLTQYGAPGFGLVIPPGRNFEFRATFARGGTYTTTARVVGVTSQQSYDTLVYATSVAELTLSGANPGVGAAGAFVNSSVTLRNIGTAALAAAAAAPNNENAVGRFVVSRVGGLTATSEVDVQFFDTTSSTWVSIPLTLVSGTLEGSFGGAGFPVAAGYDATTLFRTRFNPTGSYTVAYRIDGFTSASTYASSSAAVMIDTGAAASITAISGSPQSAIVAQPFAAALLVEVRDAGGNVVPGAAISFAAPLAGASATFTSPNPLSTDANGRAQVTVTANTVTGNYDVVATSTAGSVAFALTNTPGATQTIAATGGTPQSALVNQPFANALQARVTDQFGNGVPGVAVTFTEPGSGASSALAPSGDVTTDAGGFAAKTATANAIAGGYSVTAAATGVGGTASFSLTNLPGALAQLVKVAGDNQNGTPGVAVAIAPSVRAVDADSNPLAGVLVTYSIGVGGGSATGTTIVTDASGLATVGSWTLGGVASATNTLLAAASGVTTQTFTATADGASHDLSVTVTNNQTGVDPEESLTYAIVVANAGPSDAEDVMLGASTVGIDTAGADWLCFGSGGATCPAPSGTGGLNGLEFDLPSGGSLSFAYSTTVTEIAGRSISCAVTVNAAAGTDPVTPNNSAVDDDTISGVTPDGIFVDGFEQAGTARPAGKSLGAEAMQPLSLSGVRTFTVRDVERYVDAKGGTLLRVQALRAGDVLYVRLVTTGKGGRTPWQPASEGTALWVTPSAASTRVELIDEGRVLAAKTIEMR